LKRVPKTGLQALALTVLLSAIPDSTPAGDRLVVMTVNYPLQYFAERIGGDHVEAVLPAPEIVDPAVWFPDEATVRRYRRADLVLLNGAGYAKWVENASLPRHRQVNTSASFADGYLPVENVTIHSQGSDAGNGNTGTASTTWLDFYQAAQQAEAIMEALADRRPQQRAEFEVNYKALRQELLALDLDIQRLVAKRPGKPLFVSLPVYQYFARRYQLRLQSVAWDPDAMPPEQEWEQLLYAQEDFPAAWMIWEAQPISEIRQKLESMDIGVVVFRPCANRPPQGDFMDVMKRNIENLKTVFAES
jgi:zinc transport system substrate-binding protein